jgi:hypothetical protein
MKYSMRSLMLFADPGMGSGFLVVPVLIIAGGPLVLLGIILGVRWLLIHHASVVRGLVSLKFTIREILMMTAMVAILLGWLVDHWRQASEFRLVRKWGQGESFDNARLRELLKHQAPAPNPPNP